MKRGYLYAFFLLLFCIIGFGLVESCREELQKNNQTGNQEYSYVGSASCKTCHEAQFKDWKLSDHYKAMELPNDSTVLGDFNTTYQADGVLSKFYKKGNKFFIQTQGKEGINQDFEVKYTFGYYPLQQYLIASDKGMLQTARQSWDAKNKKWFHQYAGQKIHPRDWLHWTGRAQNWNTMCASCHSTNVRKNHDFMSDSYQTTFSEISVGCESCHGAGSKHIEFMQSEAYKKDGLKKGASSFIAKTDRQISQVNSCAPCHARKSDIGEPNPNTEQLLDNLIPQIISNESYFADGQIKDEDYEYSSFAQSKMYKQGVKCSNCHNPHSGKLLKGGNNLCLSCHDPKYNSAKHHFHTINTEGAQCVNCHMPARTYMGNDVRHDHSFRIPRPDQSVQYKTPNTCVSCHQNKTNAWAAKQVVKWYGTKRAYHFSDDLLPGSVGDATSFSHLVKLAKDTSQPAISRATAVYYLGQLQANSATKELLLATKDLDPLVRYQAYKSLENQTPEQWFQLAQGGFKDSVKAVRIAAADLYHLVSGTPLQGEANAAYQLALQENINYLKYQCDFAIGNVMLADYYLQEKDYQNAILHYIRGLALDSLMNYARFNQAAAYNAQGANNKALETLLIAQKIDPKNDRSYFDLGLIYIELGNKQEALLQFSKAVKLGSKNIDLYYNYGVLFMQEKRLENARDIFQKGLQINPNNARLIYGMATAYLQENNLEKALPYIKKLKILDPYSPTYAELFALIPYSN